MLQIENTLFTIVMLAYFASMILYFAFIAVKKDAVARVAVGLQIAGFVLHTAALVCSITWIISLSGKILNRKPLLTTLTIPKKLQKY